MTKASSTSRTSAPKEVLTRGHKKKARTRQILVDAALRIYARKGVDALLLNELAEEANVSNGTVYNYFCNREEVLDAVGLELANQLSHRITMLSQEVENGAQRVAIGVRMFLLQTLEDPVWGGAVISVYRYHKGMRSAVAAYLRSDLQTGSRQGHFNYSNEEIAIAMVASATIGAMINLLEGVVVPEFDSIVAQMLLMSLGLPTSRATRISKLPLPQIDLNEVVEATPKKRRGRPRRI